MMRHLFPDLNDDDKFMSTFVETNPRVQPWVWSYLKVLHLGKPQPTVVPC